MGEAVLRSTSMGSADSTPGCGWPGRNIERLLRGLSDDMTALKHAAVAGLGVVALPGYVCRDDVRSGALRTGVAHRAR
jgi:DNA-binding transcriptional LysR family regulator